MSYYEVRRFQFNRQLLVRAIVRSITDRGGQVHIYIREKGRTDSILPDSEELAEILASPDKNVHISGSLLGKAFRCTVDENQFSYDTDYVRQMGALFEPILDINSMDLHRDYHLEATLADLNRQGIVYHREGYDFTIEMDPNSRILEMDMQL